MKITMLAGNKNTGKTTTLLKVYEHLSNNVEPKHYQKINDKNPPDIECYPLYHHDKKVALYTAGDIWDFIKKALIKFNCIGADVLIIPFSEDTIKSEAKKNINLRKELNLFLPDNLKDIQPHCVIQKRVTINQNNLSVDDLNKEKDKDNEKDCQDIIDSI